MSLEGKFNARKGDLVVLSHPEEADLIGFVEGFNAQEVFLQNKNWGIRLPDGTPEKVRSGFDFERYQTPLSHYESYEVLRS